jgi:phosphate transport system substrate-binding protein
MKISNLTSVGILARTASVANTGRATLNGSGSTFQMAYQETAIEAYTKTATVKINYGGGGSGKGRRDLADVVVDFAGADSPYKDADLAKNNGGDVLYFPILLGPITISYHLDGVAKLRFSPDTIAKIFQRDIKKWDDKAIASDNPGSKLPDADIVVVHRSDGSGTTDNFTKYLVDAAGATWRLRSGATVEWSADTQAGNGNPGVAQIVASTNGAIGYVDLSDAKASGLAYAAIKNKAGKFVEPTSESASIAAEGIDIKDNLLFSALNAKGAAAYPITYQSWVIVYAKQADQDRGAALRGYLKFLISDGQKLLKDLDLAPLPKSLQDRALKQLDKIAASDAGQSGQQRAPAVVPAVVANTVGTQTPSRPHDDPEPVSIPVVTVTEPPRASPGRQGNPAREDNVEDLIDQLTSSDNDKVRASAALRLAKLGDPRATAASGDQDTPDEMREAIEALRQASQDPSELVRSEAQKALRAILDSRTGRKPSREVAIYVNVGPMSSNNEEARDNERLKSLMRSVAIRTIEKLGLKTTWPGGPSTKDMLKADNTMGFYVDATLNALKVKKTGSGMSVSCKIVLTVTIYPEKNAFGFLNGGASVQTSMNDIASAEENCVSVVIEDLVAKKVVPMISYKAGR